MRIRISHVTAYDYESPARAVTQILRLTPRPHEGQHVVRWRVEMDADARLRRAEDALGNIIHMAFVPGPVSCITLAVEGEVETWETHGVLRGAVERFAPAVFLRETLLTEPDAALKAFVLDVAGSGEGDMLERLHRLMAALHAEIAFDAEPTHSATTAAEAFALKRGVCQDHAQIFITGARLLGAPARYVSGHLARGDGVVEQEAAHAWAEVYVPDLGWVGFDVANCACPTPAYVRIAVGLDYLGAAPVRGSRAGGGRERLDVRLQVSHAAIQTQS